VRHRHAGRRHRRAPPYQSLIGPRPSKSGHCPPFLRPCRDMLNTACNAGKLVIPSTITYPEDDDEHID
ncbi:hypothetical protein, partial [Achromobacter sp. GbtcB20]|uniref:hypothetical protein n=1 Tax=Achromobacter sp. GbtcB20 TaxID=2824765 RepID=UPI001C2FD9CC